VLDVTGSVCDSLPSCPSAWQPITIENLVAHTSGIPDFTDLAGYEATKAIPTTPDALVGRVRDLPLEREPGASFSYSNSNYAVLGAVIENVSGMTYQDFLRTNIFEPLGMSHTGYETEGNELAVGYAVADEKADAIDMSVPYAAGALSSTVTDLLRWNQAIAAGTAATGRATTDMLTPIETITDYSGFGYGYGIYVSTKQDGTLAFHDGGIDGFSSVLVNDVGNDVTVVILSNTNDSGDLVSAAWQLRAIVLAG
jgi:CubicO group peptidase (beta-lactamase class C family)